MSVNWTCSQWCWYDMAIEEAGWLRWLGALVSGQRWTGHELILCPVFSRGAAKCPASMVEEGVIEVAVLACLMCMMLHGSGSTVSSGECKMQSESSACTWRWMTCNQDGTSQVARRYRYPRSLNYIL